MKAHLQRLRRFRMAWPRRTARPPKPPRPGTLDETVKDAAWRLFGFGF